MLVCSGRPTQSRRRGGGPTGEVRRKRNRFGDYAEERSFVSIQDALGIELDDDTKYVVVLQHVGNGSHFRHKDPCQIKWVGSQSGKDTKNAIRSGCSGLVVDDHTERLSIGQSESTSLDRFCARRAALQQVKTAGETELLVAGLELRRIAETRDGNRADNYRATHRIGKHCIGAGGREEARREYRSGRIFRACEREQIGEIPCGVADLPRPIDVIRHSGLRGFVLDFTTAEA